MTRRHRKQRRGKGPNELTSSRVFAAQRYMMGAHVKSQEFGQGVIINVQTDLVTVKFGNIARKFPVVTAFKNGTLTFINPGLLDLLLSDARISQIQASSAQAKNGSSANSRADQKALASNSKRKITSIDVAFNTQLQILLKDYTESGFKHHMVNYGFDSFRNSIRNGFGGPTPFEALSEASSYLGCSADDLLRTRNDALAVLLRNAIVHRTDAWHCRVETDPKSTITEPLYQHTLDITFGAKEIPASINVTSNSSIIDSKTSFGNAALTLNPKNSQEKIDSLDIPTLTPATNKLLIDVGKHCQFGKGGNSRATSSSAGITRAVNSTNASSKPAAPSSNTTSKPVQPKPDRSVTPIHVNEFLVRSSYGKHNSNGHRLETVRASVSILPKGGGDVRAVEFNGYWCPKCKKYYMLEDTYRWLKKQGYICCKVVEEEDLKPKDRGASGFYGNLAEESVIHQYGYNVNQQAGLTEAERHDILAFIIENRIQTTQEIASLLDWLIRSFGNRPNMSRAVDKWRSDRDWVRYYHTPTRRVRVDAIYARR